VAVLGGCRDLNGTLEMCDTCVQLDEKIEHYKKVMSAMTDQLTVERITALVQDMQAQKAALHPQRPAGSVEQDEDDLSR
jgi:hypothetical protein